MSDVVTTCVPTAANKAVAPNPRLLVPTFQRDTWRGRPDELDGYILQHVYNPGELSSVQPTTKASIDQTS
jgi:hypothetical protein